MSQPRAVLFDVHDVVYDVSQWQNWFSQSLRQIGVDQSFRGVCEFDPFPYACSLSDEYLLRLDRFLAELGLNSGQKQEFCNSARFQFANWIKRTTVFADVGRTLNRIRHQSIPVVFISAWQDERPLQEFLTNIGLTFQADSVLVHGNQPLAANLAFRACREEIQGGEREILFVSRNSDRLELGSRLGFASIGLDLPTPARANWRAIPCLSDLPSICEAGRDNPNLPFNRQQNPQRSTADGKNRRVA